MFSIRWYLIMALMCVLSVAATVGADDWDPAPILGSEEIGDKTRVPIVFVHGQNGAGDQFERQSMHFANNGYPPNWIVPFDYNTSRWDRGPGRRPGAGASSPEGGRPRSPRRERPEGPYTTSTTEDLDAFVDALRARTGFDKVNLVGHSRGTAESAAYLSDPERAAKIAHYASVGGGNATNPNGVPSIAISGMGDFRPGPGASNGGKVGWMPAYQDHVMVCTSDESFWEIYTFFNDGEKPKTMRMTPEERPQVGGYVKSYIHNKPLEGASVNVWAVDPATGIRLKKKPAITLPVAADGQWGPFSAKPGQPYEFVVHGTAAKPPPRFYRTPFTHSDRLLYFRIAAMADDYQSSPFDDAPHLLSDKNPVFVVRHQNGSLLPGVMTLTINGTNLIVDPIIPTTTQPTQSATVALYLADGNSNGVTDLSTIKGFGGAFVSSADIFIPADPSRGVEFKLNDHVLNVPALPASKAGPISVVFEDYN